MAQYSHFRRTGTNLKTARVSPPVAWYGIATMDSIIFPTVGPYGPLPSQLHVHVHTSFINRSVLVVVSHNMAVWSTPIVCRSNLQPFSQKPRSPVRATVTYQSYMNHILERIHEIIWTGIDRPSPGSWQSPILSVAESSRDNHGSERQFFKSITRRTRALFVLRTHFVQNPADVAGHRGHIAHSAASVQKSAKDCRAQWQYLGPSIGGWCTASAVSTAHRAVLMGHQYSLPSWTEAPDTDSTVTLPERL